MEYYIQFLKEKGLINDIIIGIIVFLVVIPFIWKRLKETTKTIIVIFKKTFKIIKNTIKSIMVGLNVIGKAVTFFKEHKDVSNKTYNSINNGQIPLIIEQNKQLPLIIEQNKLIMKELILIKKTYQVNHKKLEERIANLENAK